MRLKLVSCAHVVVPIPLSSLPNINTTFSHVCTQCIVASVKSICIDPSGCDVVNYGFLYKLYVVDKCFKDFCMENANF